MVFNIFDFVKAISLGNYSLRRKLKLLFVFFLFFFLVLHRSILFSVAGPLFRDFFRRLLLVRNRHIFVFVFFHAMLFVVYSLSHLTDNISGSNRTDSEPTTAAAVESPEGLVAPVDDSVEEILVVGEKNPATAPESLVAPVDDSVAEILVVGKKNTATSPVTGVSIDATPVEEPASPVRHSNSVTEAAEITPEIRRYRRTESERFEENRERGKLRRSKTEIHREDGGEAARFSNSVEKMDIDDFNRTVESFIAEMKLHIGGRIFG